jgi:hypothetical protein
VSVGQILNGRANVHIYFDKSSYRNMFVMNANRCLAKLAIDTRPDDSPALGAFARVDADLNHDTTL